MTEPLYYDKDGNPTGVAEKCACGALYRLAARRGFLLNGSADVPRMPEPAERVDAAFELARLQRERDAAQATIRNLERMGEGGCYMDSYTNGNGKRWWKACGKTHDHEWHPTLALAVAAWATANPEVK